MSVTVYILRKILVKSLSTHVEDRRVHCDVTPTHTILSNDEFETQLQFESNTIHMDPAFLTSFVQLPPSSSILLRVQAGMRIVL